MRSDYAVSCDMSCDMSSQVWDERLSVQCPLESVFHFVVCCWCEFHLGIRKMI